MFKELMKHHNWEIDRPIYWRALNSEKIIRLNLCPEKNLIRIDDPGIAFEIENNEGLTV